LTLVALRGLISGILPDVVTSQSGAWLRRKLLAWGRGNRRSFPWRATDDPWRVLVAEVLLQRSRGKTVARVYEELFRRWPDPTALSQAREASIASVIRPLGLVRRASTLRGMAREIARRGKVPDDSEGLMSLPGVGRYAANATLAVGFGKRAPVVDGVTARVYRRYLGLPSGLPATSDPDLWRAVDEVTPRGATRDWNWAVLDLASEVCLPVRPRCEACPLVERCAYASKVA
jgi:A/G-specific adenine glycosylase